MVVVGQSVQQGDQLGWMGSTVIALRRTFISVFAMTRTDPRASRGHLRDRRWLAFEEFSDRVLL